MSRERKYRRVDTLRSVFGEAVTPRLRPRNLVNRPSLICLSSDSEDDTINEPLNRRQRNVSLEMELNALNENMQVELHDIISSSINFNNHVESDVDRFSFSVEDLIDNDIPIEYHDQTLDESDTVEDEPVCIDLCNASQKEERTVLASSSSSASPQDQTKAFECPVCLEDLNTKPVYSTFCGHVYCKDCIFQVLKTTKKCPQCRKALNKVKIHPLFL